MSPTGHVSQGWSIMDNNYYETGDTFLASFLLTQRAGYRGCYVQPDDNRVIFRFQKNDNLADLVDNYTFDFEAPAKSLLGNYKFLMSQAKQAQQNHRKANGGVSCK